MCMNYTLYSSMDFLSSHVLVLHLGINFCTFLSQGFATLGSFVFPLDQSPVSLTADTEDVLILLPGLHTLAQLILHHGHLLCLWTQRYGKEAVMR